MIRDQAAFICRICQLRVLLSACLMFTTASLYLHVVVSLFDVYHCQSLLTCCCQLVRCLPLPVSNCILLLLLICSGRKPTDNVSHESDSMKFSPIDQSTCAYNVSLLISGKSKLESTVMSRYIDSRPNAATLGHNEKLTGMNRKNFLSSTLGRRAVESENRVLSLGWSFRYP